MLMIGQPPHGAREGKGEEGLEGVSSLLFKRPDQMRHLGCLGYVERVTAALAGLSGRASIRTSFEVTLSRGVPRHCSRMPTVSAG